MSFQHRIKKRAQPMSCETAVKAWTEHMRGYVGIDAEKDPLRMGSVCAPFGPPSAQSFICKPNVPGDVNSSCMLVAVGGLQVFLASRGVLTTELDEPLGFDRWARACELAKKHGALLEHCDATWSPELGDVVHVARYDGHGHAALHWFTLVGTDGKAWTSVDGGAKNAHGYQAIHEAKRSFVAQGSAGSVMELTSWKPVASCIRVGALLPSLGL